MSERFIKNFNGNKIFSLEYDKETLRDMVIEKQEEIERLCNALNEVIERNSKAIEYIEENCIDDEFYINLTNKEKHIIEVLNILKGSDK